MGDGREIKGSCCGPPGPPAETPPCCGGKPADAAHGPPAAGPWIVGSVPSAIGEVPRVTPALRTADRFGAWKARWAIGRMRYRIEPGLYAVGEPGADAPVLISANYKMSFDRLRAELGRVDAWLLVLDTGGVNVWCSAAKGTFGTDEVVRRVEATRLGEVVTHRTLVLPQLAGPGVAAHEVKRLCGFRVVYGPVRAADLPAFLAAGMTAVPEMRRVQFSLADRMAVVPVELVMSGKWVLLIAAALLLLAGLGPGGFSLGRVATVGVASAAALLAASFGAAVVAPALLPWLPGRAFALKGLWLGLALAAGSVAAGWLYPELLGGPLSLAGWCLILPAAASFMTMNFTGSTTFTSLSGVRREMRVAVPLQIAAAVIGTVLWLVGPFV